MFHLLFLSRFFNICRYGSSIFFFCFCDMCYDVEVVMLFKFIDASYRLVEICNCQCVYDEYGHAVALDDMCCHIFANVNVDCVNNKANQKLTVLIIPFHYYFFFFCCRPFICRNSTRKRGTRDVSFLLVIIA